jgi:hypothetical protein
MASTPESGTPGAEGGAGGAGGGFGGGGDDDDDGGGDDDDGGGDVKLHAAGRRTGGKGGGFEDGGVAEAQVTLRCDHSPQVRRVQPVYEPPMHARLEQ